MTRKANEAGASWSELAGHDALAAVLDPHDHRGGKNQLIDRVHKAALGAALGNAEGKRVLDFGCGTGRISDWLVQQHAYAVGVDITPEMLTVARNRTTRAAFALIDGERLPLATGSLDAVVSAYVLQYYVRGDGAIVREMARALRPRGHLVVIEQVVHDDIGRGAPVERYRQWLSDSGFDSIKAIPVRRSWSAVIRAARFIPAFGRSATAAWLVSREARLRGARSLTHGRYVDTCFVAQRAD